MASEDVALARTWIDLDADIDQILLEQVEDIGLFGVLAGGLDGEFEPAPVRQQADAIIAFGQADLVEQAVGQRRVVLGPELRERRIVERLFQQGGACRSRAPARRR